MDIKEYLEVISRRKWSVILTTLFALAVVAVGVAMIPQLYTATAKVRALTSQEGDVNSTFYNVDFSDRLLSTYAEIAKSSPVLDELSEYVSPMPDPARRIKVEALTQTEILLISVVDQDPALAQYAANKLAEILIARTAELYTNESYAVNLYIVDPAVIPKNPSSMLPWQQIVLGLVLGLFGGIGLAFIFENLDTRIYTSREIENLTGLPIIGDIPEDRHSKSDEITIHTGSNINVEAFRRLRTNIFTRTKYHEFKSLLVTSAVGKDGRTSIVANLGVSIAQTQRRVLIIDADFRWPAIHTVFNLDNSVGLSSFLNNESDLKIQQTIYPGLYVLTSGPKVNNPVETLDSPNMHELIQKLEKVFDVILVDGPSCLSVTDSAVISTYMDGVLLVVRHKWVRREALLGTIEQLAQAQAKFVGVVPNRTTSGSGARQGSKISPKSIPLVEFNEEAIPHPHLLPPE
jgi:capsular exopolysaccharide synthesis family protein